MNLNEKEMKAENKKQYKIFKKAEQNRIKQFRQDKIR